MKALLIGMAGPFVVLVFGAAFALGINYPNWATSKDLQKACESVTKMKDSGGACQLCVGSVKVKMMMEAERNPQVNQQFKIALCQSVMPDCEGGDCDCLVEKSIPECRELYLELSKKILKCESVCNSN